MRRSQLLATSAASRAGVLSFLTLSSLTLCAVALGAPQARAADAYLAAVRTCIDAAGKNAGSCVLTAARAPGDPVPVWAFVALTPAEFAAGAPLAAATLAKAVVPGPLLTANSGDTSGLTVHLLNLLPVPVSLIIPGQPGALQPVWTNTAGTITASGTRASKDVTSRVRSLTTETAPGAVGSYKWPTLNPGTFIYESATHQGIQVQMGLHGGLVVASGAAVAGATIGTAYAGVTYARQATTYLSEIDTAMHRTVDASPTHDATPAGSATKVSPLQYWPDIFLTTQQVMAPDFTLIPPVGGHGQVLPAVSTLLRFMNATLRSHVQVVQNEYVSVLADDGHPYRYPKQQYSLLLEAGKTKDAMLLPAALDIETVAVYDRMLNTGGVGATQQGMVAYLDISAAKTPVAVNDTYTTVQGVKLTIAAKGVLANDTSPDKGTLTAKVVTTTLNGVLALASDGSFTYTPTAGSTAVSDSFSYVAVEAGVSSKPATVTITLTVAPPVANADTYAATGTTPLVVAKPGVLFNDTGPAGHVLTAVATGSAHGTLALATDGSFTYTAASGFSGADTFTYTAADGPVKSAPATVTINVAAAVAPAPIANNDSFTVARNSTTNFTVLGNDTFPGSAPGNAYATGSMTVVSGPTNGTATPTANGNGRITYTTAASSNGTTSFTYRFKNAAGVTSNVATVTITY